MINITDKIIRGVNYISKYITKINEYDDIPDYHFEWFFLFEYMIYKIK